MASNTSVTNIELPTLEERLEEERLEEAEGCSLLNSPQARVRACAYLDPLPEYVTRDQTFISKLSAANSPLTRASLSKQIKEDAKGVDDDDDDLDLFQVSPPEDRKTREKRIAAALGTLMRSSVNKNQNEAEEEQEQAVGGVEEPQAEYRAEEISQELDVSDTQGQSGHSAEKQSQTEVEQSSSLNFIDFDESVARPSTGSSLKDTTQNEADDELDKGQADDGFQVAPEDLKKSDESIIPDGRSSLSSVEDQSNSELELFPVDIDEEPQVIPEDKEKTARMSVTRDRRSTRPSVTNKGDTEPEQEQYIDEPQTNPKDVKKNRNSVSQGRFSTLLSSVKNQDETELEVQESQGTPKDLKKATRMSATQGRRSTRPSVQNQSQAESEQLPVDIDGETQIIPEDLKKTTRMSVTGDRRSTRPSITNKNEAEPEQVQSIDEPQAGPADVKKNRTSVGVTQGRRSTRPSTKNQGEAESELVQVSGDGGNQTQVTPKDEMKNRMSITQGRRSSLLSFFKNQDETESELQESQGTPKDLKKATRLSVSQGRRLTIPLLEKLSEVGVEEVPSIEEPQLNPKDENPNDMMNVTQGRRGSTRPSVKNQTKVAVDETQITSEDMNKTTRMSVTKGRSTRPSVNNQVEAESEGGEPEPEDLKNSGLSVTVSQGRRSTRPSGSNQVEAESERGQPEPEDLKNSGLSATVSQGRRSTRPSVNNQNEAELEGEGDQPEPEDDDIDDEPQIISEDMKKATRRSVPQGRRSTRPSVKNNDEAEPEQVQSIDADGESQVKPEEMKRNRGTSVGVTQRRRRRSTRPSKMNQTKNQSEADSELVQVTGDRKEETVGETKNRTSVTQIRWSTLFPSVQSESETEPEKVQSIHESPVTPEDAQKNARMSLTHSQNEAEFEEVQSIDEAQVNSEDENEKLNDSGVSQRRGSSIKNQSEAESELIPVATETQLDADQDRPSPKSSLGKQNETEPERTQSITEAQEGNPEDVKKTTRMSATQGIRRSTRPSMKSQNDADAELQGIQSGHEDSKKNTRMSVTAGRRSTRPSIKNQNEAESEQISVAAETQIEEEKNQAKCAPHDHPSPASSLENQNETEPEQVVQAVQSIHEPQSKPKEDVKKTVTQGRRHRGSSPPSLEKQSETEPQPKRIKVVGAAKPQVGPKVEEKKTTKPTARTRRTPATTKGKGKPETGEELPMVESGEKDNKLDVFEGPVTRSRLRKQKETESQASDEGGEKMTKKRKK